MKKLVFLTIALIPSLVFAQDLQDNQYRNLSSLESELANAKTPSQKTNALIYLYDYHFFLGDSENLRSASEYLKRLEVYTHETRDSELIARAMMWEYTDNIGDRLFEYAKLKDLSFYKAAAKYQDAAGKIQSGDNIKALELINESINYLTEIHDDSLRSIVYTGVAFCYSRMNDYLQALQFAFQAQELGEKKHSLFLKKSAIEVIAYTYRGLQNYGKAAEYYLKEIDLLRALNEPHMVALRLASLARIYLLSNQPILGEYCFEQSFKIADSIKGSKRLYNEISGVTLTSLYISNYKDILASFLKKYRQYFFISPANKFLDYSGLGRAYERIGNLDSAIYLITKAKQFYSDNESLYTREIYFFVQGLIAYDQNDFKAATENYKQALQISLRRNNLSNSKNCCDSLKSCFLFMNDLSAAVRYYKLGDSIQNEISIQQDKQEVAQREVAALEKQRAFDQEEHEKNRQQRFNIQYLAITFSVVALFILLLLMGIFKVSVTTIRVLGFFSFLLFFEFIFLIFKKNIDHFTDGEPWKDLGLMVLLAAIMVPLHHWTEHKVIHYLSHKKLKLPKLALFVKAKAKKADENLN